MKKNQVLCSASESFLETHGASKTIMIEFSVSAGIPQLKLGIVPTHRINIGAGSVILRFWYVQDPITSRTFDPQKDQDLVELMYAKGIELGLNEFESFAIGQNRNYHLVRVGHDEFVIKSLR